MTMPHLMNCSHAPEGWCLDCVADLHEQLVEYRAKYNSLRQMATEELSIVRERNSQLERWAAAITAAMNSICKGDKP